MRRPAPRRSSAAADAAAAGARAGSSSLPPLRIASLLVLALAVGSLRAQFLNRAAWLGGDAEGVRRDLAQGTEYYLDRFSYAVVPPWWEDGLPAFGNRVDYRLGSTSGTQFTIEGAIDHALPLGDGFAFRYHVLQGENRDTRFLRNAVAGEKALGETSAIFVQAELFAEKSLVDVSAGA